MLKKAKEFILAKSNKQILFASAVETINDAMQDIITDYLIVGVGMQDKDFWFHTEKLCMFIQRRLELPLTVSSAGECFVVKYQDVFLSSFRIPPDFESEAMFYFLFDIFRSKRKGKMSHHMAELMEMVDYKGMEMDYEAVAEFFKKSNEEYIKTNTVKELLNKLDKGILLMPSEVKFLDSIIQNVIAQYLYVNMDKEKNKLYFSLYEFEEYLRAIGKVEHLLFIGENGFTIVYNETELAFFNLPYLLDSVAEQKEFEKKLLNVLSVNEFDVGKVMELIGYECLIGE